MINYVSPNNLARYRTNSLSELNEVTQAISQDVSQIVDELDTLESVTPVITFTNAKGVQISLGVSSGSGTP